MIQRWHYDEYMGKFRDLEDGEFVLFTDAEKWVQEEIAALKSLVDGVTEIVEIWELNGSPAQKEWKKDWLKRARGALK